MFKFRFKGNAFKALVEYKQYTIDGICDTGATSTALDIYSLSALTGFSGQAIYDVAINWIAQGKNCKYANTASGRLDRTINIMLRNVCIDGQHFENFYARLIIDSELWKTDGLIVSNGKETQTSPMILIGLDIVRSCNFTGNKDVIELDGFNKDMYTNTCERYYIDTLNLYELLDCNNENNG